MVYGNNIDNSNSTNSNNGMTNNSNNTCIKKNICATFFGYRGLTLRDCLERLPREWISEELMEALESKGVHLSPTLYDFCSCLLVYLSMHPFDYRHPPCT
jgi:hypothetical protein